jgi:hypothetical protein
MRRTRLVLVGRPITDACMAASASQNCCCASNGAVTALTWSRASASSSKTLISMPL